VRVAVVEREARHHRLCERQQFRPQQGSVSVVMHPSRCVDGCASSVVSRFALNHRLSYERLRRSLCANLRSVY